MEIQETREVQSAKEGIQTTTIQEHPEEFPRKPL